MAHMFPMKKWPTIHVGTTTRLADHLDLYHPSAGRLGKAGCHPWSLVAQSHYRYWQPQGAKLLLVPGNTDISPIFSPCIWGVGSNSETIYSLSYTVLVAQQLTRCKILPAVVLGPGLRSLFRAAVSVVTQDCLEPLGLQGPISVIQYELQGTPWVLLDHWSKNLNHPSHEYIELTWSTTDEMDHDRTQNMIHSKLRRKSSRQDLVVNIHKYYIYILVKTSLCLYVKIWRIIKINIYTFIETCHSFLGFDGLVKGLFFWGHFTRSLFLFHGKPMVKTGEDFPLRLRGGEHLAQDRDVAWCGAWEEGAG